MKYELQVETHLDKANIKPYEQGWRAFESGDILEVICVQNSIAVVIVYDGPVQKDLTRYHIPLSTLQFVGKIVDKMD